MSQPAPKTYEQVFKSIFKYIDKIFSVVRPRKLLFLAIDGVAPRAKMNQQRSRRFRAAKEAAEKALKMEGLSCVSESEEKSTLSEQLKEMDSNVITPGTEFMALLSSALRYYIRLRMNGDSAWRGIKVILSDANVPGEGEHKIMSYIRLQRDLPGFDPNTRHCLYGLDADLIMLALAAHEAHFSILREYVDWGGKKGKLKTQFLKNGKANRTWNWKKRNVNLEKKGRVAQNLDDYITWLNFQFLNIWVLREYLEYDMRIPGLTFEADLERLIDDFVLMCLFVGNDFLPHIPTLSISEGAIDLLMMVYKKEFVKMGGYLTDSFQINFARVEHFIQALSSHEGAIFRKRNQIMKEKKHCSLKRKLAKLLQNDPNTHSTSHGSSLSVEEVRHKLAELLQNDPNIHSTSHGSSLSLEEAGGVGFEGSIRRLYKEADILAEKIKLGEDDWKERYYEKKFEAKTKDEQERVRRHAVVKYIEGICWVMRYYYFGVCSWQWFYPYHYAPFASDFCGLDQLEIHFTLGEPFKPFDQLMAVLPAASASALPPFYRKLMTDESSPILDFYPSDFRLDMNGKRRKWQAICILPFIEESRLLSAVAQVEHTLTDEEKRRNSLVVDILFVHVSHPLADIVIPFSKQNSHPNMLLEIDPKISGGMNGFVCHSDESIWSEEVYSPIDGMQMITNNEVISIMYKYPLFHFHISRLPQGVILPGKSVREQEISPPHIWHETVVSRGTSSRRPIPKSIAGSHLANLSHRLVSLCNPTKQEYKHGYKGPGFRVDASRLGGSGRKVIAGKWNKDNRNSIGDRYKRRENGEGEGIPHNAGKLKQSITSEQREGNHAGADGIKEIKIEILSKKAKRKLRREQNEGFGVPDKDVVELEHRNQTKCDNEKMDSYTSIEKLEGCIAGNKRQGYDAPVVAEEAVGIKTQVNSSKRKRRSRKRRQIEAADSCSFKEERNHANACALWEAKSAELSDEKLDSSGVIQQIDGNAHQVGANGQEIQTSNERETQAQINTKKKKRRSKARSSLNCTVEPFDSCGHIQQVRCDGNFAGASGLVVPSKGIEMKQIDGSQNNSLDGGVSREQGGGSGDHVGVSAALEINTVVKSRKRKPRSKKRRKIEDALPMVESGVLSKEVGCDGNIVGASILVAPISRSEKKQVDGLLSNGLEEVGAIVLREQGGGSGDPVGASATAEINTDVKSRKRKSRSKKRFKIENLVLPVSDSGVLGKQVGCDANILGASGLVGTPKGSVKEQPDVIPNKSHEKVGTGALREGGDGYGDHIGVGAAAEINAVVKSRKRKPRSKRRKIEDHSIPTLDSDALSKQVVCDGNIVCASGLEASSKSLENKQLDGIPNNSVERIGDGIFREQGGGSGDHVGVGAAAEINTCIKSRKRKSRSKRRRKNEDHALPILESDVLSKPVGCDGKILGASGLVAPSKGLEKEQLDGNLNNILKKVEAGVLREQGGGSGDHAGVDAAVETNSEGKSKKRRSRSKKRRKIADQAPPALESCILHKQAGREDNIVVTSGLVVPPSAGLEKRQLDRIPINRLEEVEAAVLGGEGVGSGDHVGVGEAVEVNTEVKPKKRKPRSKKRRQSGDNALPVLESGVLSNQISYDGNIAGASGPVGHLQDGEKETLMVS
ncbi:hypothetical protein MANES_09G118800v8 [Manihot esculenta]|uniref:Uncharacterized protein n=1 Tax=Manihot esculenta TaxID=3983 RepID=A0ACB7H6K1_MANES|nr:hypothetical protein MANES_09G118800v8 [Manihot esculenta]